MIPTTVPALLRRIADAYELPVASLGGRGRTRRVVAARQAAMWALRARYDLSHESIGQLLNRDHTTVMFGVNQVETARAADPAFAARLDALIRTPEERPVITNERIRRLAETDREALIELLAAQCIRGSELWRDPDARDLMTEGRRRASLDSLDRFDIARWEALAAPAAD